MKTDNVKTKYGSSNVFADLELPDANTHLLKAAKLLGLSQPDVSHLLPLRQCSGKMEASSTRLGPKRLGLLSVRL